ncbi:MAG: membrane dipeptidase [Paracoccaceae bacterium]
MRILKKSILVMLGLMLAGLIGFWAFAPGIIGADMNGVKSHEPYVVSQKAAALHKTLIIGDWHADSLLWKRDLLKRGDFGQVDFPRMAEGNAAIQVFTTVTKSPAGLNYEENAAEARDNITLLAFGQLWPMRTWNSRIERALYQSQKLHEFATQAPDVFKIIRTKSDLAAVLAARNTGAPLMGALIGAEGGHALDGDIANLARMYDAGFRVMGLQHFFDNRLGGSLHGVSNAGLTDFGREVVRAMGDRNMIIDLAHSSPQVAADVLAMVDRPVIVSHTGIHAHCPVKRNFPDALMQRITAAGGLIAIGYWQEVTCDDSPKGVAATIMAAIDLLGVEHVSLGSDYDGSIETSFDISELAALTEALMQAGLPNDDIALVMGGNMMQFLAENLPD